MSLPEVSLRQLLESGVHFGHQAHRWNPKMGKYIFGARNNIHILDLAQTVPLFSKALKVVSDTVAKGGRVLIVGTKRQASELVADAAKRSAQYYVNSRWLGGMLTNWKTISNSIQRLKTLEEMLENSQGFTKKERLTLSREVEKLNRALGGIRDMGGLPDLIVVIDTNKESLAIKEAQRLNIPVAAILDSNCDPEGITYPIPGNDDAGRAIALYCDLIARAAIDGIGRSQSLSGQDLGAMENPFIQDASEPVQEIEGLERLTAPRGAADDLSKLTGVGPAVEKKLNEFGVFHYWQIAGLSDDAVAAVDAELKLAGRIQRDGWVNQARELVG